MDTSVDVELILKERLDDITQQLDATQRTLAFIIRQINRLTDDAERRRWRA